MRFQRTEDVLRLFDLEDQLAEASRRLREERSRADDERRQLWTLYWQLKRAGERPRSVVRWMEAYLR